MAEQLRGQGSVGNRSEEKDSFRVNKLEHTLPLTP